MLVSASVLTVLCMSVWLSVYMGALCYAYLPAEAGNRSGYYGFLCAGYTGEHYETDIDECASSYGYCVYYLCRIHRCSL